MQVCFMLRKFVKKTVSLLSWHSRKSIDLIKHSIGTLLLNESTHRPTWNPFIGSALALFTWRQLDGPAKHLQLLRRIRAHLFDRAFIALRVFILAYLFSVLA